MPEPLCQVPYNRHFIPSIPISASPRPNRGRARGRLNAGTAETAVAEMRPAGLGIGPETSGPVGAVAVRARNARAAAQAVWSRRASRAPPGYDGLCGGGVIPLSHRPTPQRWVGPCPDNLKRERGLKGQSTGGHMEQASNTARGTPTVSADLRFSLTRQASVSRGAEVRGSSRPRRSARPRIYFPGNGILSPAYGVPGAAQTTRAAERWLFFLAPRLRGEGAERA